MSRVRTSRRFFGKPFLGWLAAMGAFLSMIVGLPGASSAEKVIHTLDWVPYGRDAGFYVARAKGFFQAEGLTLEILPGKGSGETIKRLTAGEADYGTPDAGVAIISRAKGSKVKMIGAFHDKTPMMIVVLKGGPVRSLKDMEGRTFADAAFSSTHRVFPALARKHGLDPAKVKWDYVDPAALAQVTLMGKVDGWGDYTMAIPSIEKAAKMAGKDLVMFRFAENGVDLYSNTMSATEERLAKSPDQVRRFMRAMYNGIAWAVEHPEEAVEITLKENPILSRDTAMQHWQIAIEHLLTDAARKHGIGHISREKMSFSRDVIAEAYDLKEKPAVDDLYTMEFLPKIMVKK